MPDNTELVAEVESLKHLFVGTAQAVIETQQMLDGPLGADFLSRREVERQAMLYSIPRTSVDFQFGLSITSTQKVLLILSRKKEEQRQTHQLKFSLVAVPEPPSRMTDAQADAFVLPFYLIEPNFLLSPEEEALLYVRLINALTDPDKWESVLTKPVDLNKEVKRIIKARADTQSEQGLVFFRLSREPDSFLIVRVTDKNLNDSVFVLTPDKPRMVRIYSVEDDDTSSVRYAPFHRLALNIRRWIEGEPPHSVALGANLPPSLGLEYLQPIASSLREGYVSCLNLLAAQKAAQETLWPVFYDLTSVRAELSYSVEYRGEKDAELNFSFRRTVDSETPDEGRDYKLIESKALIRAGRDGDSASIEVELAAPEFVLAGSARNTFLNHINADDEESIGDILDELADGEELRRLYKSFLADDYYRRIAVILLSYRGAKPKEEFLVIWPGEYEGEAREFVFTCKIDGGRLKVTKPILGVDQDVRTVEIDTAAGSDEDTDLSKEQYQAFHNFFHAVRIWRARISRQG